MEIVIRSTVVFFFLFVLLRAIGKRDLADMTPFDIVILVVLGDLIQQGVTQEDASVTGALLAAGTMVFWVLVISWASFRSRRALRVVEGQPVVVVKDGEILEETLRLERLPREELLEAARQQGIDDLRTVAWALLEPGGRFSFIRRS
mgnify:CR=1 FL=1|jgi:uncharacterized membrane protein YcaP (DUF421 family)